VCVCVCVRVCVCVCVCVFVNENPKHSRAVLVRAMGLDGVGRRRGRGWRGRNGALPGRPAGDPALGIYGGGVCVLEVARALVEHSHLALRVGTALAAAVVLVLRRGLQPERAGVVVDVDLEGAVGRLVGYSCARRSGCPVRRAQAWKKPEGRAVREAREAVHTVCPALRRAPKRDIMNERRCTHTHTHTHTLSLSLSLSLSLFNTLTRAR
jgi:hypothetical protein